MKKALAILATLTVMAFAGTENFGGLGISVWTSKGGVKVAGVIPNSPAESIGLQAGDLIVSAGGVDLASVASESQISYLRGEAGTSVDLVVNRDGAMLSLSAKRVELSVQNLDSKEIADWYGKNTQLSGEELNYLAEKKTGEGYKLLGVMQFGMPVANSAENLNANAIQQIAVKNTIPAVENVNRGVKQQTIPNFSNANASASEVSFVNVKGAAVKETAVQTSKNKINPFIYSKH